MVMARNKKKKRRESSRGVDLKQKTLCKKKKFFFHSFLLLLFIPGPVAFVYKATPGYEKTREFRERNGRERKKEERELARLSRRPFLFFPQFINVYFRISSLFLSFFPPFLLNSRASRRVTPEGQAMVGGWVGGWGAGVFIPFHSRVKSLSNFLTAVPVLARPPEPRLVPVRVDLGEPGEPGEGRRRRGR